MKHTRTVFPLLAVVLLSGALVLSASAAFGPIILVSHSLQSQPAVEQSLAPAISADGRYVVYSWTSALQPPNPLSSRTDIYLYDRDTGFNQMISRPLSGEEPNGVSTFAKISADGRWVAFLSKASNLLGDSGDTSIDTDLYILDRDADTDGVFDESNGTALETINLNDPGELGTLPPIFSMTADGQQIAYRDYRLELPTLESPFPYSDIYVIDRQAEDPTPVLISVGLGEQANGSSTNPVISPTGRYVAFSSQAYNLVAGDTNEKMDVFLRDRDTDQDGIFDEPGFVSTIRISVSNTGMQGNDDSGKGLFKIISPDERWVIFDSFADNLVPEDDNINLTYLYSIPLNKLYTIQDLTGKDNIFHTYAAADLLGYSRWLAYSDCSNSKCSFLLFDRSTGNKLLVNEDVNGQIPVLGVDASAFSKDGGWVAFESDAEDLVAGGDHSGADIFLRELGIDPIRDVFLPVLFGQ